MAAAAITLDKCVEQQALGSGKPIREFYQIGPGLNTQGAQPGQPYLSGDLGAQLCRLITVELKQRQRHLVEHARHIIGAGVDEQARYGDERTGAVRQLCRTFDRDVTRAGWIENKPDRIGADCDGVIDIGRLGQATQLDTGTVQRHGGSGIHRPACSSNTPRNRLDDAGDAGNEKASG